MVKKEKLRLHLIKEHKIGNEQLCEDTDFVTNKSNSGLIYLNSHVCSGRFTHSLLDFTCLAVNKYLLKYVYRVIQNFT